MSHMNESCHIWMDSLPCDMTRLYVTWLIHVRRDSSTYDGMHSQGVYVYMRLDNDIGAEGATLLAGALMPNETLTTLHLESESCHTREWVMTHVCVAIWRECWCSLKTVTTIRLESESCYTCEWVIPHESLHTHSQVSLHTHSQVVHRKHILHMNESCNTVCIYYIWMSHVYITYRMHILHMNESCGTPYAYIAYITYEWVYEWVITHICIRCTTWMSCHTYESHIFGGRVDAPDFFLSPKKRVMSHVNESWHTYE